MQQDSLYMVSVTGLHWKSLIPASSFSTP